METSYQLREIVQRNSLPDGTILNPNQYGPPVSSQNPLGNYLEDYKYVEGYGDLNEFNGRFCITPEYPEGTFAYFVTISEIGIPEYPYVIGPSYYGVVQSGNTGPQSGHNSIPNSANSYNLYIDETENQEPFLVKMIDILGREYNEHVTGILMFYIYDNGEVKKLMKY